MDQCFRGPLADVELNDIELVLDPILQLINKLVRVAIILADRSPSNANHQAIVFGIFLEGYHHVLAAGDIDNMQAD